MSTRLFGSRRMLMSLLIFSITLLATGCTTTFLEYSGKMANQGSNNHVKPYQGASTQEDNDSESVWRALRIPAASRLTLHQQVLMNNQR